MDVSSNFTSINWRTPEGDVNIYSVLRHYYKVAEELKAV